MEVFISWSGNRSEKVAEALRDWLPNVIQSVRPFMSESDINRGSRWSDDLATHLQDAKFGLICLTQENLKAPWMLFEAGALSKSIENTRVVPYLYRVSLAQLEGPLAQFQAAVADKVSTLEVMKSINGALEENGLDSARLESAFEAWWPQLQGTLNDIPETTEETPPPRTDRDILEEILFLSREMSRQSVFNSKSEQDALSSILANWTLSNPDGSTQYLDADWWPIPVDSPHTRANRRQNTEHLRRNYERHLRRLSRESHPHNAPSSEGEVQASEDGDKETDT